MRTVWHEPLHETAWACLFTLETALDLSPLLQGHSSLSPNLFSLHAVHRHFPENSWASCSIDPLRHASNASFDSAPGSLKHPSPLSGILCKRILLQSLPQNLLQLP